MAKFQNKKEDAVNIITDPKELEKFKSVLVTITHYLQIIEDQREAIKETIEEAATIFSIDKKIIRKLSNTMFKSNYADIQEENRHFELLYETIVGRAGKLADPLDDEEDDTEDSE